MKLQVARRKTQQEEKGEGSKVKNDAFVFSFSKFVEKSKLWYEVGVKAGEIPSSPLMQQTDD
jgi:hypothetical protein